MSMLITDRQKMVLCAIATAPEPIGAWVLSAHIAPRKEFMPERKFREYVRTTLERMAIDGIVYKAYARNGDTLYGITKFGRLLAVAYAHAEDV
jgi:hypothetical protein